ncbi:MAG TPA: rod shape-determining protein, partial [Pyrinomonadaceae bacterium]|nr:rod shape-determining protein [Pyrinomonadaceae bacterium]
MAIDMGTSSTIIAVRGRDIVLDEPSYIAVNELTNDVVAYGQEAYDMIGREGRDITVVAPLSGGVVADFEKTKRMLAFFVRKSKSGGSQVSTQAVMSIVSDVTHVEQRALMNAAEEAHIGKVHL